MAVVAGAACAALLVPALAGRAAIFTMTDGNSSASIDPTSQAGMFNWSVNGQNQLYQQWFWYRIGSNPDQSIDTISAPTVSQPSGATLNTSYSNASVQVQVDYTLNGSTPPSGVSDIGESIKIHNFTAAPMSLQFIEYSDFDLLDTPGGDTVQLGTNLQGQYDEAYQTKGDMALTETVAAPGAILGEVGYYDSTLTSLNSGTAYDLNNNAGPVGPGDVTWALQWNLTIPAGGDVLISKDKYLSIVPEPASIGLLSLGLAGVLGLRRRR